METRSIATLLLFSLLISAVSAAPASSNNIQPLLNSALTDAQCRVAFETGFMGAMISSFPVMSSLLSPRIADMQSDKSQLSQYASRGDAMNYSAYTREKFSKHLQQDAEAVKAGFEGLKNMTSSPNNGTGGGGGGGTGGGTGGAGAGDGGAGGGGGEPSDPNAEIKAAMESLTSTYKSLRDAEDSCFNTKEHAYLVLSYYDTALNSYQMRAQNLTGRGINVSNLLSLVGHARSEITVPLQNGVNSATNSSQLRILLNQYCLYDGCANGTNFHMAAKFENIRIAELIAAMSLEASQKGFDSNVTAVKTSIYAASDEINSWGDKDASPDQLKAAWTSIMSAAKGSHSIFIALNGSAGAS